MTDKSEVEQLMELLRYDYYDLNRPDHLVIEDLAKLIWYLDQRVQTLEGKEDK